MVRPNDHTVDAVVIDGDCISWYVIDGRRSSPEDARNSVDADTRIYVGQVRVYSEFFKDKYSYLKPENKQLFDTLSRTSE